MGQNVFLAKVCHVLTDFKKLERKLHGRLVKVSGFFLVLLLQFLHDIKAYRQHWLEGKSGGREGESGEQGASFYYLHTPSRQAL